MNPAHPGALTAAVVLSTIAASGLAQEPNAAAERARLAEQRIQAEAARRLEDEQASVPAALPATAAPALEPEPTPVAAVPQTAREQSVEPRRSARPETPADLSLALEQLRTLGELKDSGYVDDEEFERIKQRILDANL